jgi:uncharacterized protein (DUF433 family)
MRQIECITMEPTRMDGNPCIRGTRVTVGTVVGLVAEGYTPDEILEAYPHLEREDVWRLSAMQPGARRRLKLT